MAKLKLSDNYVNVRHIYKGELVQSYARANVGDFVWETSPSINCDSTSIGSLLLDFNNFRADKTVFLLHTAEYMEKPSLLTLARMAKYCDIESQLALNVQQTAQSYIPLDEHQVAFKKTLEFIRQTSRTTWDWSYARLLKLVRILRHSLLIFQDSDDSDEDVVLIILTQWSSQVYRAILSKHGLELDEHGCELNQELFKEIFEHMYAIFFRLKVCNIRSIAQRRKDSPVHIIPRVPLHYLPKDTSKRTVRKRPENESPRSFTPRHFLRLLLCGNISNFTKTKVYPLHRAYRLECDLFVEGDHHQLLTIKDNARIVANNIDLLTNCTKMDIAAKRLVVLTYNKKRQERLDRLHRKQTNVFMGLSVRPALKQTKKRDGSFGQSVFVKNRPTWFYPTPLPYPNYTSPLLCDRFFWTNPVWMSNRAIQCAFPRPCIRQYLDETQRDGDEYEEYMTMNLDEYEKWMTILSNLEAEK